jgi:hypothetical protein
MLLVNGATKTVRQLLPSRHLGVLLSPGCGNRQWWPEGTAWAVDNGAFGGFDERKWTRLMDRLRPDAWCRFVVAPDKLADAAETRKLFDRWGGEIAARGFRVAYVLQDGETGATIPWGVCDAIFIGGSDAFKLSRGTAEMAREAKARGKWVHLGRVNSHSRLRYAFTLGCDSVDGSSFSWFSDTYLPRAASFLEWLAAGQQNMRYE